MNSSHSPSALHWREIMPFAAPSKHGIVCTSPHFVAGHTMPCTPDARHRHSPMGSYVTATRHTPLPHPPSRMKYMQCEPGRPPQLTTRRASLANTSPNQMDDGSSSADSSQLRKLNVPLL